MSFVDRHNEETAGEIAMSSLASPSPFQEQKEKKFFMSVTTAVCMAFMSTSTDKRSHEDIFLKRATVAR